MIFLERLDEPPDVVRRIAQVDIHRDDDVTGRVRKRKLQRLPKPEIMRVANRVYLRVSRRVVASHLPRCVGTAIVDDDGFPVVAIRQRAHVIADLVQVRLENLFFIQRRDDNRNFLPAIC